jgi:hypothetical protein
MARPTSKTSRRRAPRVKTCDPYDDSVDAVLWKAEELNAGPVYVRRGGKTENYRDSDVEAWNGGYFAEWFTRAQARQIAADLGLPFAEV